MTEALACTQQAFLTYLLEVLIVDDAPQTEKEPFFCLGCVIKNPTADVI